MTRARIGALIVLAIAGWSYSAAALGPIPPPLVQLRMLSDEELKSAQVRLDYLGPEDERLGSVIALAPGSVADWAAFSTFTEITIDEWERRGTNTIVVQPEDLRKLFAGIENTIPDAGQLQAQPRWLSIAIIAKRRGAAIKFFAAFDQRQGKELMVVLRSALRADPKDFTIMNGAINIEAMRALQSFACAADLLPREIPAKDITAQIEVTRGGFRLNVERNEFEQLVTLRNKGSAPIPGPISIVIDSSTGAVLRREFGYTCVTAPAGRAFVTIPMPAQSLAGDEKIETTLAFAAQDFNRIQYETKVLAGPGER